MRRPIDTLIALSLPLLICLHVYIAPYTKVEESFSLQATHDILAYGVPLKDTPLSLMRDYDHFSFPGSVPRTFVGPLALAGAAWPLAWLVEGLHRQMFIRAVLGLYNAFSMIAFRNRIAQAFGRETANWYIVFQASQFHLIYYASRTLPNFFAFGLSTLALRFLMPSSVGAKPSMPSAQLYQYKKALILLTSAGVIFRSEITILLGTHTIWLLVQRRLSFTDVIRPGLLGFTIGLGLTIPIDSFFWQKFPLWPELSGFIYNVMKGQSVNWGSSPFYYYFTSALPRLLLNPLTYLVCIPTALSSPALQIPALDMLIPNLAFVVIYSFQPHKEWRFIIYAVPPLTAAAAMGATWIWNRRAKSMVYRTLALALVASTLGSFAGSLGMLVVSSFNYPGAQALNYLHTSVAGSKSAVRVHMDTLSCMTGVTRFLQVPQTKNSLSPRGSTQWFYDKTENETRLLHPVFWNQFDYALAERPEKAIGGWDLIHTIESFTGLGALSPGEGVGGTEDTMRSLIKSAKVNISSWKNVVDCLQDLWKTFEYWMRKKVTSGWWLQAKMEPRIRVLRSTKEWIIPKKDNYEA